jgi:hypothetical protein
MRQQGANMDLTKPESAGVRYAPILALASAGAVVAVRAEQGRRPVAVFEPDLDGQRIV